MMLTCTVREQERKGLIMSNLKGNTAATFMANPRTLNQLTLLSIHSARA